MYTLSPSKSIKGSNYREFLRQKCIVMYTTVQVRSEFGKFAYTAICMRNVYTLIIHAFLLVFIAQIRSLSGALQLNLFGGVMVSVLASSAVDRGFEPGRVKPKTMKLVFVASPLRTQC